MSRPKGSAPLTRRAQDQTSTITYNSATVTYNSATTLYAGADSVLGEVPKIKAIVEM